VTAQDSNPALPGWADGLAGGPPGLDGVRSPSTRSILNGRTQFSLARIQRNCLESRFQTLMTVA
jgi:hypothetical protein